MSRRRPPAHLLDNLVLFGRSLRLAGLGVSAEHIRTVARAWQVIDLARRDDAKDAARAVMVQRQAQRERFDRLFDLFWRPWPEDRRRWFDLGRSSRRDRRRRPSLVSEAEVEPSEAPPPAEGSEPLWIARPIYSTDEVLRRKDFSELSPREAETIRRLLRDRPLRVPLRRTRRFAAGRRGPRLDVRRTLQRGLRTGGEPLRLVRLKAEKKRRPVVVLCDVSGSMEAYSRIFLQLIYALRTSTERLEAFVFGTRLTRITRQLRHRHAARALEAATTAIPDWGGGTRIGESIRRFNFEWGRRVLGQGSIVVVVSDGWDRGEIDLLDREVGRLRRSCHRLLWLNPLLGTPGYEPLTRGIRTILPYVDSFLPLHNLESLEQVATALAAEGRGRGSGRAGVEWQRMRRRIGGTEAEVDGA